MREAQVDEFRLVISRKGSHLNLGFSVTASSKEKLCVKITRQLGALSFEYVRLNV